MDKGRSTPPQSDEVEVSLFGPGYGEAIAIHVGNGEWVLVDSCLDPDSGKPASLEYLDSLGVDVSQAVKLIVATHWHDDHVSGISDMFEQCAAADIAVSGALNSDHFFSLVQLFRGSPYAENSGVREFSNVFQILQERKERGTRVRSAMLACLDRKVYSKDIDINGGKYSASIHALSPSDASIVSAGLDFYQRLPSTGERKRKIPCPTQNHTAVVLWVEIGKAMILLGSDLERTGDPETGWEVIINKSKVIRGKAGLFKVPHHGSENAHESKVWSGLLSPQPFAILSPYYLAGKSLPTEEDVERITSLTNNAFITASAAKRKARLADRVVREFMESIVKNIQDINIGRGHIRLRRSIVREDDNYRVELFEDAKLLAT